MSTMIERIARALASMDAIEPDPDTSIPEWRKKWRYDSAEAWVDAHWRERVGDAQDAIKAMQYADEDKAIFVATAERHEIRPLVLISAFNELLERFRG